MQCRLHLLNLLGIVARDVGEESLAISLVVFAQLKPVPGGGEQVVHGLKLLL